MQRIDDDYDQLTLDNFYPYLSALIAGYITPHYIDNLYPLIKHVSNTQPSFAKVEKVCVKNRCTTCNYSMSSKGYQYFLSWAKLEDYDEDVCLRCEAQELYQTYIYAISKYKNKHELEQIVIDNENTLSLPAALRMNIKINQTNVLRTFDRFISQITTQDEVKELIQFLSIFPSCFMTKDFVMLIRKLQSLCKKFDITPQNTAIILNTWWYRHFNYDINYIGLPIIRSILFPNLDELHVAYEIGSYKYKYAKWVPIKISKLNSEGDDNVFSKSLEEQMKSLSTKPISTHKKLGDSGYISMENSPESC
jgi:hypothetical protein